MREEDIAKAFLDKSIYSWTDDQLKEAQLTIGTLSGRGPLAKNPSEYLALISQLLSERRHKEDAALAERRHKQVLRWAMIGGIAGSLGVLVALTPILFGYRNSPNKAGESAPLPQTQNQISPSQITNLLTLPAMPTQAIHLTLPLPTKRTNDQTSKGETATQH